MRRSDVHLIHLSPRRTRDAATRGESFGLVMMVYMSPKAQKSKNPKKLTQRSAWA